VRAAVDPNLPRRVAAGDELLLDIRCVGLGVPAILVVQPVLQHNLFGDDARLLQLGVDDGARLCGLRCGCCVHEHRVLVVRHREAVELQLVGELARTRADVYAQPLEEPAGSAL
jgi:hypothetical protein